MTWGSEEVTRKILGNVPGWLAMTFYVAAAIGCTVAAGAIAARLMRQRQARRGDIAGRVGARRKWPEVIVSAVRYLSFHEQLLRDPYAGLAHLLMFYGFSILFIGTCLVFLEHDTPLHFFYGWFYQVASLIVDLGGVAFLTGLGMFLYRRHVVRKARILKEWWVAALSWLLFGIGVTGFLLEGARIARDFPEFERWSAGGYATALAWRSLGVHGDASLPVHRLLWSLHAGLCLVFFALLPWKFFGHMVYGLPSWSTRALGALSRLPVRSLSTANPPGAVTWTDFTWQDVLQTDACTTCGRCNEVCPATAAGKPLQPRDVMLGIRQAVSASKGRDLAEWISDDTLWSCTTCAACSRACPVGIDVYGKIVEMRRGRVERGAIPEAAEQLFEGVAGRHNPFQKSNDERLSWTRELAVPVAQPGEPIELLYWVGCAGSFSPEGQSVSRAMVKILNHLGVNYRVLGCQEGCTGDPARRLGEEGLFQELANRRMDQFQEHQVKGILTHCPHCFNTFRNEYPQLRSAANGNDHLEASPEWTVEHHTVFLARMIGKGRLKLAHPTDEVVTFHDPCYLGRGNGETEAPREVLQSVASKPIVEMPRHGRDSMCCGAGGGAMWNDVRGDERIENIRMREAIGTGAAIVATGCPFCKTMLEAGNQAADRSPLDARPGTRPRIRDVAELIVEAEGL